MTPKLIIQLLLIVAVIGVAWRLLLGWGQKAQALRRLGFLGFAAFAVLTILFPDWWNRMALKVGVGRGADLILYGMVVAFFSFVVTTFKRFRDMDIRYTRLARRIAIDETPSPADHPALAHLRSAPATIPPPVERPDERPDEAAPTA